MEESFHYSAIWISAGVARERVESLRKRISIARRASLARKDCQAVVGQFEFRISRGVIPKGSRFYERAKGSPGARSAVAGDPSLRLKNGYADDIDDQPDTIRNSN